MSLRLLITIFALTVLGAAAVVLTMLAAIVMSSWRTRA
jgi:hypothetical protein